MPDPTAQGGVVELVAAIRAQVEHQQRARRVGLSGRRARRRAAVARAATPRRRGRRSRRAPRPRRRDRSSPTRAWRARDRSTRCAPPSATASAASSPAGRTNLVFGVGNPNARLMFVGEGARRRRGRAGRAVRRARRAAADRDHHQGDAAPARGRLHRNVIKCRPPDNRNPEPDEVASCEPFLRAPDRADPARGDRRARQVRRADAAARRRRRSRSCAGAGSTTTASG